MYLKSDLVRLGRHFFVFLGSTITKKMTTTSVTKGDHVKANWRQTSAITWLGCWAVSPLCILGCLYVYQPFPFVAQVKHFFVFLGSTITKEIPTTSFTQGDHVKANWRQTSAITWLGCWAVSPLCILGCLYVYQPFPFVAQVKLSSFFWGGLGVMTFKLLTF